MIEFAFQKQFTHAGNPYRLDLSASLPMDGFTALFGPSGAGKTTLLRLLAGLEKPDAGYLRVEGRCWYDAAQGICKPPQQRSIGFVFQDYALFPNLTVRANIAYGCNDNEPGWIDELLELTGLSALQTHRPHQLSGGQKQRVALARALAPKPRLLLLDEPLSALDAELRIRLQDDLLALQKRLGFAAVVVTHDLGEVFKLSRQVLVIEQGRLLRSGTAQQLFLQQRPSGKFNLPAQILDIRQEDVVYILTLLIGQEMVDIIANQREITGLRVGDWITVSNKAFSPLILPHSFPGAPV